MGPMEQGRYRDQLRSVQQAKLPLLLVAMTDAEGVREDRLSLKLDSSASWL